MTIGFRHTFGASSVACLRCFVGFVSVSELAKQRS